MIANLKIIILGDFNADIGRGNTRDKRVRAWADGHGLISLNMLYTQKIKHTFLNIQGHFSAIDQIFIYGIGSWIEVDRCNVVTSLSEISSYNALAREVVLSSYESYRQVLDWLEICKNTWDMLNFSDHRPVALDVNVDKVEEFVKPI